MQELKTLKKTVLIKKEKFDLLVYYLPRDLRIENVLENILENIQETMLLFIQQYECFRLGLPF